VRRLGSVRDVQLDVRIVAATHVDLPRAVREGRFRRDLFYRLSVAPLHLPPLRERDEDVLVLAEHFLDRFGREYAIPRPEITPEIREALLGYAWPGNVRELRNSIERAVLFGKGSLRREDLFLELQNGGDGSASLPFPASLREIERAAAHAMVERFSGNKTDAAKALGISRKHLYALLREDGIARGDEP
jgi:DNA-binding NtrC family response regulator